MRTKLHLSVQKYKNYRNERELQLACRRGKTFLEFDLVGSSTNHNHEEIIENIETYQCVAIKSL